MAYTNIDDPSAYFQTATYTGTGSSHVITNDGNSDMQPDWVWIKSRSHANWHSLHDSSRGATKGLFTNDANPEVDHTDSLTSFNSDGFTLGADSSGGSVNVNTRTYVGWQWHCNGGTTSSNTDGTITSTVQANQDAGFSIVTFTGTGSTATVGHGLGVKPSLFIIKNRNAASNWFTYTTVIDGSLDFIYLNSSDAKVNSGLSAPTTSVFTVNSTTAPNTNNIIAYCFAEKQGYSKFGSYIGNGSGNGPFVYTGFKPAFVMFKRSTGSQSWDIHDSTRDPFNPMPRRLLPNLADAEETRPTSGQSIDCMDFLSNGFKIRSIETILNASGDTFVYMAFAENPFVTSTGIPTTAR